MKAKSTFLRSIYAQRDELNQTICPHIAAIIRATIGDNVYFVLNTCCTQWEGDDDKEDEMSVVEGVFLRFDDAVDYIRHFKKNTDDINAMDGVPQTGEILIDGLFDIHTKREVGKMTMKRQRMRSAY